MTRSQHNDPQQSGRPRAISTALRSARSGTVHDLLRCASSGYADGGERCHAHVPASAASEAWHRETLLTHRTEGFFHFLWRGGEWLAYAAADGSVRGVYCATHCAQRRARIVDVRTSAASPQPLSAARAG